MMMMHSICDECWEKKNPGRQAVKLIESIRQVETCCYCSNKHRSGIYVRGDSADMPCNGVHGEPN
jgi:hypothetical protein